MAVVTAVAAVVGAVAAVGGAVYAATRPTPTLPTPQAPMINAPPAAPRPPDIASVATPEDAEAKARAAAACKQRDLESRRSGSSTILTTPLGVSTPPGNVQSSVLGR